MKKCLLKLVAMLMIFVMLLMALPAAGMQAIAEEIEELKNQSEAKAESSLQDVLEYQDELISSEATDEYEIIEEVVEKRSENQKEFLLSDGSFLMAIYGNAVRYEENGKWADIDNTVVLVRQLHSTILCSF